MKDSSEIYCNVICVDGQHFLKTPNGELIKGVIFTRVHTNPGEYSTCIVKMKVNVIDSNIQPPEPRDTTDGSYSIVR